MLHGRSDPHGKFDEHLQLSSVTECAVLLHRIVKSATKLSKELPED